MLYEIVETVVDTIDEELVACEDDEFATEDEELVACEDDEFATDDEELVTCEDDEFVDVTTFALSQS